MTANAEPVPPPNGGGSLPLLDSALAHAAKGWRVLPCHHIDRKGNCSCSNGAACTRPGKHPRTAHGLKDASSDANVITGWWTKWPKANPAVLTGKYVVIDLDIPANHDAFKAQRMAAGADPVRTYTVATGSPGAHHLYFEVPPGVTIRNSQVDPAVGFDIRGDGGYVLVPPSVNVNGGYCVKHDSVIAPMPGWLVTVATKNAPIQPKPRLVEGFPPVDDEDVLQVAQWIEGTRHRNLVSLTGKLIRVGLEAPEVLAILRSVNQTRCVPPHPDEKLQELTKDLLARYGRPKEFEEPHAEFRKWSDVMANVPPEPEWLWRGYLAPNSLTLLGGAPKVGKSTVMFALMGALENGSDSFLGQPLLAGGAATLLLTEEREGTLKDKEHLLGVNGGIPMRLDLMMHYETLGIAWEQTVDDAMTTSKKNGNQLLLVDTLPSWAKLSPSEENDSGAMINAVAPLAEAAGSGLAVLINMHNRKSGGDFGEGVRGSNALTAMMDIIMSMTRVFGGARNTRRLSAIGRYSSTPEENVIAYEDRKYVSYGADFDAKHEHEKDAIYDAVRESGSAGLSAEAICGVTNLSRTTVNRRLEVLIVDEMVERSGRGRKGSPHTYRLAEEGDVDY